MAVTFVAYAALGWVGVSLSVPPGVAAPVWPGAGVALVAVLLGGWRHVPAVWAASLVVNLYALGDAATTSAGVVGAAIAGLGACAQAVVGAALARRFVAQPTELLAARDAAWFVVLIGPIACLASAAIGPTVYVVLGLVPKPWSFFEHIAWFTGDAVGTLGVAPLALALVGRPRDVWRPRVASVGVPLVVALALCVAAFQAAQAAHRATAINQARLITAARTDALRAGIVRTEDMVSTIAAVVAASERVTPEEFATFVQRLRAQDSGVASFAWFSASDAQTYPDDSRLAAIARTRVFTDAVSEARIDAQTAISVPTPAGHELVMLHRDRTGVAVGHIDLDRIVRQSLGTLAADESVTLRLDAIDAPAIWRVGPPDPDPPRTRAFDAGGRRWFVEFGRAELGLAAQARLTLALTYLVGLTLMTGAAGLLLVISGRTALLVAETEQRRGAEDRLSALADELARSNRDLEQFAYIASHDLRSPLRAIRALASWIESDTSNELGAESRSHLRLLQGRAERLDAMVEGLLAYSRAGRGRSAPEPIDTGDLVKEAIDLAGVPPAFRVDVARLPRVYGQRSALQQVFANLISNAVRHHDAAAGVIGVSAEESGAWVTFSVRDDGPGVPPDSHALVFTPFKKLMSRDQVEGSGLGLSIVQRLVEAEGGTVGVESDGGRGARFWFTWPLHREDGAA